MTAMTVAEARTTVARHLDDSGNARWSTAEIDEGLAAALDMCQEEYAQRGGHWYRETVEIAVTSSDNGADVSTYNPARVVGVAAKFGDYYFPLDRVERRHREVEAEVDTTLAIDLVRRFALSTTTSEPLIGNGATAENEWKAMEHWMCVRAALHLSTKDNEVLGALEREDARLRDAVLGSVPSVTARPFPTRLGHYSSWYQWTWEPSAQKVFLHRKSRLTR